MKYINTSSVAVGAAMPYKSTMIDWIKAGEDENNLAFIDGLTNNNTPAYLVLYGCTNTIVGSTHTISAGAIVEGGVISITNTSTSVTLTGSQVVVGTITTIYPEVGTSDPVTFSDSTTHNVHAKTTIVWSAGASGSGDFNYTDLVFLNNPTKQTGTIATAQWDNGSGGTTFNYYKIPFNKLVIDTTLEKQSAGSATIITLPSGYRPKVDRYFTTFGGSANPDTILTFKIDTSGNVTLHNSNGTLGLGAGDVYTIYCEIPLY